MTTKSTPKTVAEWRSERRKKAKQEGGYIRIPMELWNGEAFHSLTKSEKLVLLECLAQLRYAPKSKKKRQGLPIFTCGLGDLSNNGEFGLPTKYLQERGIKGQDTIARAKTKLVEVGFLDVVTQGSFTKAGRFRYSDRWRTYNSSALLSETGTPSYDGPLPGYCHYANIAQYNAIRAQEANDPIADDAPRQLDLFADYANTAERRSHQGSTGDMVHICDVQKSNREVLLLMCNNRRNREGDFRIIKEITVSPIRFLHWEMCETTRAVHVGRWYGTKINRPKEREE